MLDFSVTFFITIINITILFIILRVILFKPVTKFMAERAKRVEDLIDHANKNKAETEKMLAEYEKKLENSEAQTQEIINAAEESAERHARQIIADGELEAQRLIAAARMQIQSEHQAALAKFKQEAAALVMAASAKLAAKELDSSENRQYVNMILDELTAQKGKN